MEENRHKNRKSGLLKTLLSIFVIVSAGILLFQLVNYQILPNSLRIGLIVGLCLLLSLFIVALFKSENRGVQVFSATVLILLGAILAFGDYYLISTTSNLQKMSQSKPGEEVSMSLIAQIDYKGESPAELNEELTLVSYDQDKTNIEAYLGELAGAGYKLKTATSPSYIESAGKLLGGSNQLMILNEAYRPLIEDVLPDFAAKTRVIRTDLVVTTEPATEVAEVTEAEPGKDAITEKPSKLSPNASSIFLSGIDTYGSISRVSRSDVNIVVTLNTDKKDALILSIPRDSYVPIAGLGNDQKDKLTHAGIYGVTASVNTIENLLNTEIPYYFRVNFSSFEDVINTIGGIELDNPIAFSQGGHHFPQGRITLYGSDALAFVRERYTLSEGDVGRSKNQALVIEAIFRKMLQPEMLLQLPSLMDSFGNSIDTNMTPQEMMKIANTQIETPGVWNIHRSVLKGYGRSGLPSYAMPGWDLYMYELDEESVKEAHDKILEMKIEK